MEGGVIIYGMASIMMATLFSLAWYHKYRHRQRQAIPRLGCFNPWYQEELFNEGQLIGLFQMGCQDLFSLESSLTLHVSNGSHQDIRGLTLEEKLGVTLYRLGHGSSYETVGHLFNIGKSMAYKASQAIVQGILVVWHDLTIT
ncbi:hypothetical protein O181_047707 [Austropuccinia psidii MF-1]|uniref:Uncharacterized protein n=1 Tax=Austropuccinia psidii MF-1 TaxID=1389203 RepID=A0A9Q3DYD2_9BASI|nr:hypothetical protein [Austropuccinia psidii MF-1]